MTRKRQVATCFLVLMGLLSVVFRLEIKDSLVALSLFARRYSSQDGQSWWHFLNDKARNDWWYIVSAHQVKNTKIPNISLDFRTEICYTMCK